MSNQGEQPAAQAEGFLLRLHPSDETPLRTMHIIPGADGRFETSVGKILEFIDMADDSDRIAFLGAYPVLSDCVFADGRIRADSDNGTVYVDGKPALLRSRETQFLLEIGKSPGRIVDYAALQQNIQPPITRSALMKTASRTREQLGPLLGGSIKNVRRVGFVALLTLGDRKQQ